MLDLINGKDTLKVHEKLQQVFMSQPDYPYHLPVEITGIQSTVLMIVPSLGYTSM